MVTTIKLQENIFVIVILGLRIHPNLLSLFNTMSNIKLFESKKVRTHWDAEKEQWFFSVIDVIEILTESPRPRKYFCPCRYSIRPQAHCRITICPRLVFNQREPYSQILLNNSLHLQ